MKPKLRPGQRWRPNRGPWRYINAIDQDDTEIHWNDMSRDRDHHWCYSEDFQNWIESTNAKLVRRKS